MYLTGDWIKPIKCDDILSPSTKTQWELVYFGNADSLADPATGSTELFEELKRAAITERYSFNDEVQFFSNTDVDCASKHGLRLSV